MHVAVALSLSLSLVLGACDPAQPAQERSPARAEKPAQEVVRTPPPVEPTVSKPAAPTVTSASGAVTAPPERGCLRLDQRVLESAAQQTFLASLDNDLWALVVLRPDTLSLLHASGARALTQVATAKLDADFVRGSLVASRKGAMLAYVDARARVRLLSLDTRGFGAPQTVAEGADRRFAPALFSGAHTHKLVAFTRTVDAAMHVFVARVGEGEPAVDDVTPESHGASAPTFVKGHDAPVLVMIDARAGVSPLLEVGFDAAGRPLPAVVRTPVSQPYAPPLLRAVSFTPGEIEIAYTATGSLAATAVGRVPLRAYQAPVALLPSRGYGELAFDAVATSRGALFAIESPRNETPGAARAIELKLLDAQGEGAGLSFATDGPTARLPSLARGSLARELWLTYSQGGAVHLMHLSCDL